MSVQTSKETDNLTATLGGIPFLHLKESLFRPPAVSLVTVFQRDFKISSSCGPYYVPALTTLSCQRAYKQDFNLCCICDLEPQFLQVSSRRVDRKIYRHGLARFFCIIRKLEFLMQIHCLQETLSSTWGKNIRGMYVVLHVSCSWGAEVVRTH